MEEVRNFIRKTKSDERKTVRESLLNRNRTIGNLNVNNEISKEDLIKKANALKVKSAVTSELLSELKDAFLQNKENIDIFLSVDGALHGLVRALSGQSAKFQIKAAYCLCNLALGNEKRSLQIIHTAGPYLILHLEGMNNYLIEACAWAIGNLSSHGAKCVDLLKTQGAFPNLARLLSNYEENIRITALYSLGLFVYHGYEVLEASDFQLILHPSIQMFKDGHYSSAFLTSLLSSNHHCQLLLLQEGVHLTATTLLLKNLQESEKSSIFYLRIISNLINETTGEAAFQLLNHTTSIGNLPVKTLHKCLELIFNSNEQYLIKESFWLLGNLLNHSNQKVRELLFESGILKDFESIIADKRNYL